MRATALAHFQAGRFAEAEAICGRLLAADPADVDLLLLAAFVACRDGRFEIGIDRLECLLALRPDHGPALVALGAAFVLRGQHEAAADTYRRALDLPSVPAGVPLALGRSLLALGDTAAAIRMLERAATEIPDDAPTRYELATAYLMAGDFEQGWPAYRWRWQTPEFAGRARHAELPPWRGAAAVPPDAGRLLVWGEQGVGDEIMFAGAIPALAATGIPCLLDCDPRLVPLFRRSFPNVAVRAHDVAPPDIAAQVPSGDLARGLGGGLSRASAYLKACPSRRAALRARYADGRPLVGLSWHTVNPRSGALRSIALSALQRLLARADVRWVSLQYGVASGTGAALLMDDQLDPLADLDGFAAQVAAMDLVVTIDNSTAHMAGALGLPTWLLLPFEADWRWMTAADSSLWYPSARLFRQRRSHDWAPVIAAVDQALTRQFA